VLIEYLFHALLVVLEKFHLAETLFRFLFGFVRAAKVLALLGQNLIFTSGFLNHRSSSGNSRLQLAALQLHDSIHGNAQVSLNGCSSRQATDLGGPSARIFVVACSILWMEARQRAS
jgi:hypothetical protein